jgi:hypothetical protein
VRRIQAYDRKTAEQAQALSRLLTQDDLSDGEQKEILARLTRKQEPLYVTPTQYPDALTKELCLLLASKELSGPPILVPEDYQHDTPQTCTARIEATKRANSLIEQGADLIFALRQVLPTYEQIRAYPPPITTDPEHHAATNYTQQFLRYSDLKMHAYRHPRDYKNIALLSFFFPRSQTSKTSTQQEKSFYSIFFDKFPLIYLFFIYPRFLSDQTLGKFLPIFEEHIVPRCYNPFLLSESEPEPDSKPQPPSEKFLKQVTLFIRKKETEISLLQLFNAMALTRRQPTIKKESQCSEKKQEKK